VSIGLHYPVTLDALGCMSVMHRRIGLQSLPDKILYRELLSFKRNAAVRLDRQNRIREWATPRS